MIETSIAFDQKGLNDFGHQLRRLADVCGYEPEKAVRMATVDLLKSLRASTIKSKTTRTIRPLDAKSRRRWKAKGMGDLPFVVERYDRKSDQIKETLIFAASLAEAKKARSAKVRYSGLARMSWSWAMRDLFATGPSAAPFKRPSGAVAATKSGTSADHVIKIENRLEYVLSAFQGSGPRAVSTATARAAASMRKHIARKLEAARK